ncbi:hypothetical protein [Mycobacterium palustre]|uniref:hypothetical protein n=1 Tax=Mycobacterium palustre TaxID=153971 RepID=UPI001302CD7A|nr:hypothetical protein [Mycobacterium palustre]MCV7101759.1 hypothetical protein [Mycobacterium palustre]
MHNGKPGTLARRVLLAAVFSAFAIAAASCMQQPGAQNPAPAPPTISQQNSR